MTDALARTTASLAPGEQILWSGEPDPRVWVGIGDLLLIPFSAVWLGFVVFIFVGTGTASHPIGPSVFILPIFLAIGVYFLVGRFFVGHYVRVGTRYVLTTSRAMIVSRRSVETLAADTRSLTTTWQSGRRRMSVNFGYPPGTRTSTFFGGQNIAMSRLAGRFSGWGWAGSWRILPLSFDDVADVQGLELALRNLAARQSADDSRS